MSRTVAARLKLLDDAEYGGEPGPCP